MIALALLLSLQPQTDPNDLSARVEIIRTTYGVPHIRARDLKAFGYGLAWVQLEELDRYLEQFRTILPLTSGVRRAGSAALDLADLAAGRLDGFWELSLAPWDVAAGVLLVREAGGVVTDLDGRDAGLSHGPIVAGNPAVHSWLLETMKR